jgi:hypothetical protein
VNATDCAMRRSGGPNHSSKIKSQIPALFLTLTATGITRPDSILPQGDAVSVRFTIIVLSTSYESASSPFGMDGTSKSR